MISRKVADKVGLRPVGYWRLATASHSDVPTLAYSVDLVLDFEAGPERRRGHLVFEFAGSPHSSFDILLGRDILCDGHLTLSLDGRVVFSL